MIGWPLGGWQMGEVWMPCSSPVASGTWRISKDGALTRRVLMVVAWRWGVKKTLRCVGSELVGLKKGWRFLGTIFFGLSGSLFSLGGRGSILLKWDPFCLWGWSVKVFGCEMLWKVNFGWGIKQANLQVTNFQPDTFLGFQRLVFDNFGRV